MIGLLATVLFLFASAATSGPPSTSVEGELRLQYDRLERAFETQDIATILSLRDPRLLALGPNGQRDDYDRMAESARQWFRNNKPPIESHFTLESVTLNADGDAVVRVLQRASRFQERDGKLRKVEHEVRQRETWTRTPDGWKMLKVDEIDLANRKRWIDGELEKPPPH